MRIACLHTAESNIAVFDAAAREINLPAGVISHHVRADLLEAAERAGGLKRDTVDATASALRALGRNANAVLLTCSTLGPSVCGLEQTMSVPALRVDAALARQALSLGGKVVALCAVETTLGPTTQLFAEAAELSHTPYEVRLVRTPGRYSRLVIVMVISQSLQMPPRLHIETERLSSLSLKHPWPERPISSKVAPDR